jgi:hypothetical protein
MIPLLLCLFGAASAAEPRSVDEVLARFDKEPAIREVQQMVLDYSKTDNRYVDEWLRAAKNSAWLPEINLEYDYGQGNGYDYLYEISEDGELDQSAVDLDHDVKVKAKWKLDRLVMSSDRIRVISETQDIVKLRDKVLEEVTRLYFDRRRHQVDMMLAPGGDLKAQLKAEMRLQELTAQLDAYTGGRFSGALPRK